MEKQEERFNKEKERLKQKMAADAKAHQEQTTNMIKASMQKAEQDRRAMMQENEVTKAHFEEMKRYNQELEKMIKELKEHLQSIEAKLSQTSEPGFLADAVKVVAPIVTAILGRALQ